MRAPPRPVAWRVISPLDHDHQHDHDRIISALLALALFLEPVQVPAAQGPRRRGQHGLLRRALRQVLVCWVPVQQCRAVPCWVERQTFALARPTVCLTFTPLPRWPPPPINSRPPTHRAFLQSKGVNSYRSGIVQCIAEKCNILMPGIYDDAVFEA